MVVVPAPDRSGADSPAVDFNRDIRPILSESCYQCHGPDANKRKADLRLDTRDGLFRSADGSTVVVPGKPDESELWLRITSDDPETRMPPPKAGKPLAPAAGRPDPPLDRAGSRLEGALVVLPPDPAGDARPSRRRAIRSTGSSAPGWRPRGSSRPPRPTARP